VQNDIIDLFSGVGGLSLGAARAGFNVAAAVEIDPQAVEYHAKNFPKTKHIVEDVTRLNGRRLLEIASIAKNALTGLVGGPPCQGFSDIGLRGSADPRNELLVHFFRLVAETHPAFFLAENVPGLGHMRNAELVSRALQQVPQRYILLRPITVRASDYGAPTTRTRMFFFGYDPERIATLIEADFRPKENNDVRVRRALAELPAIRADWQSETQSWRSVGTLHEGFFESRVMDHVPSGVGDPESLRVFGKHRKVSGFLGTIHTAETLRRLQKLRPGTRDPISKCFRLDRDGYCPTLRAGTARDRGAYQAIRPIHPGAARVICPREAARLQGFPDWFQFHPTKWHSFRQIGNSVSPIVAEALLGVICRASK
jgi:DNA (cytosine-5)-methyltransferase 1